MIVPTLLLGEVEASEAVLEATPVAVVTLAAEAAVVKNATSAGKSATSLGAALKAAEAATEGGSTKAVATVVGMEQEEGEQAVEVRPATLVAAMDTCPVSRNPSILSHGKANSSLRGLYARPVRQFFQI